jgi:hypothetical protein
MVAGKSERARELLGDVFATVIATIGWLRGDLPALRAVKRCSRHGFNQSSHKVVPPSLWFIGNTSIAFMKFMGFINQ